MSSNVEHNLTPIQKFYNDSNVLITGVTGFIGQLLLEKLIRACPSINTVYVLVRKKNGKDVASRLEKIFNSEVYDGLHRKNPDFAAKVVAIEGDCNLPRLGISKQDWEILVSQVSIIFHLAAATSLDEPLKDAVQQNVIATQYLMKMAKNMSNLKVFIHTSTAYSFTPNYEIEEKLYTTPIDYRSIINIATTLPPRMLSDITPTLLQDWPNTYLLSKALAELLVQDEAKGLPVGIYRPAIVTSTYNEPLAGWINNVQGPIASILGVGSGLIHCAYAETECNVSLVPADMVVNGMISTAWDIGRKHQKNTSVDIPIYHYESTTDNPITWQDHYDESYRYGQQSPSIKQIWHVFLLTFNNLFLYKCAAFMIHYLPAAIIDFVLGMKGQKPMLIDAYKQADKYTADFQFYMTRDWLFKSKNIRAMIEKMNEKDKELFFCDIGKLNWDDFWFNYWKGARVYLLKDPIDTVPEARKLDKGLRQKHYFVMTILVIIFYFTLRKIVSTILNICFY